MSFPVEEGLITTPSSLPSPPEKDFLSWKTFNPWSFVGGGAIGIPRKSTRSSQMVLVGVKSIKSCQ